MIQDYILKAAVELILKQPHRYRGWSVQGLGMLRLYIKDPEIRLHIWDSRIEFDEVSKMHTHPWNFESYVVAGQVENIRYRIDPSDNPFGVKFKTQRIHCGVGGGLMGAEDEVNLIKSKHEIYMDGDSYCQKADEIHESHPSEGTVTIIVREMLEDTEHADVFWEPGKEWVTAEPRPATSMEVDRACRQALELWF